MIVQPRGREARARRSAANRELALGLVLLALVSAFLIHYGLGYACRDRTGWPCRPSDVLRASREEPTEDAGATAGAPLTGVQPYSVPTGLPQGSPAIVAEPTLAWPTEGVLWPTEEAAQPASDIPPTAAMPNAPIPALTTEPPLPTLVRATVTPAPQLPGVLPATPPPWPDTPGTSYP